MSQSVLIAKGEERSRRNAHAQNWNNNNCNNNNNTATSSSSENNAASSSQTVNTIKRRIHSNTTERRNIASGSHLNLLETIIMSEEEYENSNIKNNEVALVSPDESRRMAAATAFTPFATINTEHNNTDPSFAMDTKDAADRASPTSVVDSTAVTAGSEVDEDDVVAAGWVDLTPKQPTAVAEAKYSSGRSSAVVDDGNYVGGDDMARIRQLEQALRAAQDENASLREMAEVAQSQRSKTLGNLKKKRTELAQALQKVTLLEKELEESDQARSDLQEETASLKLGLQKVCGTKEMVKAKLQSKDEMLKDLQQQLAQARQQLQKMEHVHTVERELLEHYRKLARHTGYFRWGKPIRALESELADQAAAAAGNDTVLSAASF